MNEEKYTVSLTEGQILIINHLVCEESYKISNKILACEESEEKDGLRKKRDRLMELNDSLMDTIFDIMYKYDID